MASFTRILVIVLLASPARAQSAYNIADFGAKPDGQTLATQSIQSAIDQAASAGGGTILFPPGKFLSGTLRLKSNITLHLSSGAVLLGSTNIADYPNIIPAIRSYTDNYVKQSLVYGEDLSNVSITGRGVIDGQGAAFKIADRSKPYENRPYLIRLINCRNVSITDLHMTNSPMWVQHYLACERLLLRNLTIVSHANANNDGIDIDSCRDVTVSDCVIDSEDDAITLKSTLDRPCENVAITNCIARSRCNAIKMGTESNGGFRDIAISNCVVTSSRIAGFRGLAGIALEIVDGGSLERVAISNITIKGVTTPIFMRLGNRARSFTKDGPVPPIGTFKDVTLSNIIATDCSPMGSSITGLPDHPIENVTLSSIRLTCEATDDKSLVRKKVPEFPEKYPECTMFGPLPSFGLYIRHAKSIQLRDVILRTHTPDPRPPILTDDVHDLAITPN